VRNGFMVAEDFLTVMLFFVGRVGNEIEARMGGYSIRRTWFLTLTWTIHTPPII